MTLTCDKPGTLVKAARDLLRKDTRDLLTIHKASGLPLYWLKDFKSGKTAAPSVNRVQTLFEYYMRKPLPITDMVDIARDARWEGVVKRQPLKYSTSAV